MRFIKIVYDNDTKFILDTVLKIPEAKYIEAFNVDDYKQKKKAIPILTRFGTKNVPLIVFEDENLEEINAIWSENNPNWELEIKKILSDDQVG